MSRQDEIEKIAKLLDKVMITWGDGEKHRLGEMFSIHMELTEMADYLVDNSIRSKEGFEIHKEHKDGWYGEFIAPIDYREEI